MCVRPFRAAGPRLNVERVGDQTVVHNYGHGGSGWSLSWGSGAIVTARPCPFPTKYARRSSTLTFNIASYSKQLLHDFLVEGGKLEPREFHTPSDLQTLPQKVIINCTGYGARALWKDDSLVPVRGQIAWLIPQPEVNYAVGYKGVNILSRRDGIVVQDGGIGEMEGYNDANETPDRPAAEAAVATAAELFRRMG